MIITVATYEDFNTVVSKLLAESESPTVFGNTQGDFWFAWAIIPSKGITVAVNFGTGEPETFANDYPGHIDLRSSINVQ